MTVRQAVTAAIAVVCIALLATTGHGPTDNGRDPSPDGRQHTCGYVTADGVTDHLAAYWARCGRSTP